MSDLTKVVQKLTETNKRLETLERQNTESGTPVELLKAALPEILSERAEGKKQRTQDKELFAESDKAEADRDKVAGSQFDKAQNPRAQTPEEIAQVDIDIVKQTDLIKSLEEKKLRMDELGQEKLLMLANNDIEGLKKIDEQLDSLRLATKLSKEEIIMNAKSQKLQKERLSKARLEEEKTEESERRKEELASAFSPLKDGLNSIGKFFGGLKDKAKGGALTFLKAFGLAAGLGALIAFLESDFLKNLLSEENLKKIADGIKNMGNFFDGVLGYFTGDGALLTPTLLDAVAIGAAIIGIGAGIKLLRGFLFPTQKELAKATRGAKLGGLLKFTLVATAIGALASGISEGFKRYKETGKLDKAIIAGFAGTLNFLTFGLFGQEKIEAGLTKAYEAFVRDIFNPIYKFLEDAGFTGFGKFSDAQLRVNKARNNLAATEKSLQTQKQKIADLKAEQDMLLEESKIRELTNKEQKRLEKGIPFYIAQANGVLKEIEKRVTRDTTELAKLETPEFLKAEKRRLDEEKRKADLEALPEMEYQQKLTETFNKLGAGNPELESRLTGLTPAQLTNNQMKDRRDVIAENIITNNIRQGDSTTVNKTISDIYIGNPAMAERILSSS